MSSAVIYIYDALTDRISPDLSPASSVSGAIRRSFSILRKSTHGSSLIGRLLQSRICQTLGPLRAKNVENF
jgi:hypothetical protein